MKNNLWDDVLSGTMKYSQDGTDEVAAYKIEGLKKGLSFDEIRAGATKLGLCSPSYLSDFFNVSVSDSVQIPNLPEVKFIPTVHTGFMENYGLQFMSGVYYSGDTVELPVTDFRQVIAPSEQQLSIQDTQFFKGGVYISYDDVLGLRTNVRRITRLGHLGGGWDKKDPTLDGFAGYMMQGDIFEVED
jgi:hypothetical protein